MGICDTEPIFKEGEKVWIFGDEKGKVIKETSFRIFLVEWEDDGVRAEIDYMSLTKRTPHALHRV